MCGAHEDGGGSGRKESKLQTSDRCKYKMQKLGKVILEAS
jgi:hypothetical protein